MTARVFQFPQYAAERSAQLTSAQSMNPPSQLRAGGRPWGWLFLLSLVGGIWSVVSGYVYWTSAAQHDTGTWLLLGGIVLLAFSALCLCLCLWVWRFLYGEPTLGAPAAGRPGAQLSRGQAAGWRLSLGRSG